jgi:hypothetical protein
MKVIQTFWTKPFTNPSSNLFESRFMGGFVEEKHLLFTWALSLMRLKEHFSEIHLVTDNQGKKVWIDFFELPYTSYSTNLETINSWPSDLWGVGKLKTYSKINEPFVHFDVDVILGDKFDKSKLDVNLIAEFHYSDIWLNRYQSVLKRMIDGEIKAPQKILDEISSFGFYYNDYNLGITGGRNFTFFQGYAENSLNYLNLNLPLKSSDKILNSFLNCFFEQYLFYQKIKEQNESISLLIEKTLDRDIDYQKKWIEGGIRDFEFVHLHGMYKVLYPTISEKWLKEYYPQEFKRISKKLIDLLV